MNQNIVLTSHPYQKIDTDGVSNQWEGDHIRFSEEEEMKPLKWRWSCGRGSKNSIEGLNLKSFVQNNVACIAACTREHARGGSSNKRVKTFNGFCENAKKNDIIYLYHNGLVKYYGVYTGKLNFGYEKQNALGWLTMKEENHSEKGAQIHVEEWFQINNPFKGHGEPGDPTIIQISDNDEKYH